MHAQNYIYIYGPPTGPFSRVRPNRTMRVFKLIEYFTWPDGTYNTHILYDMEYRPRKSWFLTPSPYQPLNKKKNNNHKRSNVIRFSVIARRNYNFVSTYYICIWEKREKTWLCGIWYSRNKLHTGWPKTRVKGPP